MSNFFAFPTWTELRIYHISIISLEAAQQIFQIGISAGNDETALGMLQAIYNAEMRNVFVVGCDCTREMRLAVDRNQTTALATIDADIRGRAQKIV
jgi:hypothetical protein